MATKNDSNRELQGRGRRQRNGSWQGVGKFKEDELELSTFIGRSACQVSEEAIQCQSACIWRIIQTKKILSTDDSRDACRLWLWSTTYQGEWMHLGLNICKGKFVALHTRPSPSLLKVQGGKSLELKHGLQSVEYTGQKGKRGKEMRHHTSGPSMHVYQ